MHISDAFDGGNIAVLHCTEPTDIQLTIRPDVDGKSRQWFFFRLSGARDLPCRLRIVNAAAVSYPAGWDGYQAVCSSDGVHWHRVDTRRVDGEVHIHHTPAADVVWFASFAPFTTHRHADLLRRCQARGARVRTLGSTLDGQGMDVVEIGEGDCPIWVVARQHPGESMASWFADGLLDRLLDPSAPEAQALRQCATIHVVPVMNPDGARRGHLRTNAAGVDLNRSWASPSMDQSPEVALVRADMLRTGAAIGLDVHGDEAIPYCFASRNVLGIPDLTPSYEKQFWTLLADLDEFCADFQVDIGYPRPPAGRANLAMCSTWMAHHLGTLALTIEQPFKDNALQPDPVHGWSPQRSRRFGAQSIHALLRTVERL